MTARQIFKALDKSDAYPFSPEQTGFYTYAIAIILLLVVSLISREKSGYWDLGGAVRRLNEETDTSQEVAKP